MTRNLSITFGKMRIIGYFNKIGCIRVVEDRSQLKRLGEKYNSG